MELIIKKVRKGNICKKVKEIYNSSFPKEERIPFWMMFFTSFTNTTDFFAFYDDDTLIGFTYMAKVNNILFIMFLAVDENTRCKGYGSKILNLIKQKYPNDKIIISVTKENNNSRESNIINFCSKNDFKYTGYLMKSGEKIQEIFIYNGDFKKREFQLFFHTYSNASIVPKIWEDDLKNK